MTRRKTVLAAVAGLIVGLLTASDAAYAFTPNATACRATAKIASGSTPTTTQTFLYTECRFDAVDADNAAILAQLKAQSGSTPAPSVSPSTSPTPTKTPTPSPSSTSSVFPDATNTGVPAGTTLATYTGPVTITTAGTVIDSKTISSCLVIRADNVTIRRSKFTNTDGCYWQVLNDAGNTGLVLSDVELTGGADATIAGDNYTLTRANIHGSVDGLKAGSGVTIQDTYIHDLAITADSHNDGVQSLGTTSLKMLRNRIVMADGATSAVILSTGSASDMRNVSIDGNLLGGGAFTVYGGYQAGTDDKSKVSNIAITGNQFTTAVFPRSGAYGPLTSTDSPVVVSGNTWADGPNKGQPVS